MFLIRQTWRDFRSLSPKFLRLPVALTTPQRSVSINILPAELVDQIFDQLQGDIETLSICSLVCVKWRVLSQPRLFRSIVLSTQDIHKSIQFQRFMLEHPHIRAGVREVTVHFPDLAPWPADRNVAANLMADVLELLPRPESLRLYGARFSDHRIKWSRLSNHLHNSIRTILHRPSLTHLLIDGWVLDVNLPGFNSIFLNASPSLTSISLLDISDGIWGTSDILQPPSTHHQLDKLTVSNTFTKDFKLIEWLCKPESIFDLQQLKTLRVVESRDDASVTSLVSTIGPSLERLEVHICFAAEECIGLNHCTGLRTLSLSLGAAYTELYHSNLLWICDTLATVPDDNLVEDLSLSIYITHPRNVYHDLFPPPHVGRFNYDKWARLGAVLSSPRFSTTLNTITIQVIHHGIDVRGYCEMAGQRMGALGGSSKLVWRYLKEEAVR